MFTLTKQDEVNYTESRQAGATLAEQIRWDSISIGMSSAGLDAYRAWKAAPAEGRVLSGLVASIYSAMEAARIRETS